MSVKPRGGMSRPELYAMIDDLQATVSTVAEQIRSGQLIRPPAPNANCSKEALEERIKALETALRPFAEQSLRFDEASMDIVGELAPDTLTPHTHFTHADLRAARAALNP